MLQRSTLALLVTGVALSGPALAADPKIELIDAGAEPRQKLRYKFQTGQPELVEMDMTMSMAMKIGPMQQPTTQLPTMRMHMKMVPEKVSKSGELTHSYVLERVEVLPSQTANPMLVTALKNEMKNIEGLGGEGVVTDRGFIREAKVKLPPNPSAQLKQLSGNLEQSMRQMAAPLPEEPVGKGAKWKVTTKVQSDAITLDQVATYELVALNGDTGTFNVVLDQSAPPQKMNAPGMPPGASVELTAMSGKGKGTTHFDLTRLVPRGTVDGNMKMDMQVSHAGQKQPMGMEMGMKVEMRPKK